MAPPPTRRRSSTPRSWTRSVVDGKPPPDPGPGRGARPHEGGARHRARGGGDRGAAGRRLGRAGGRSDRRRAGGRDRGSRRSRPRKGTPPSRVGSPPGPPRQRRPLPTVSAADGDTSDAERERDEYLALAQRTQAEFDNYRKRAARDVAVAGSSGEGRPGPRPPARDRQPRARAGGRREAGEAEQGLAHGVRFVHDELIAALGRSGIERFDPSGEPFDPNQHEAIATRPEEGVEAGHVLDVAQKGYRGQDTVVRPARVVVSA
ncbi:MAG: nucleotide exchange factor GrpE [Thermoleophilaceae bacterium]